MESVINFLLNNYIWFLVISLILLFALIGYLVDTTTNNVKKKEKGMDIDKKEEFNVHPSLDKYMSDEFDKPLIMEDDTK